MVQQPYLLLAYGCKRGVSPFGRDGEPAVPVVDEKGLAVVGVDVYPTMPQWPYRGILSGRTDENGEFVIKLGATGSIRYLPMFIRAFEKDDLSRVAWTVLQDPDDEWGEVVAASLILKDVKEIDTVNLTGWLKEKLPSYKIPRKYVFKEELPRNVMGKVSKNELKKMM